MFPTSKGLSTLSLVRGPNYGHANSDARACPSGYTPCTAKNYAGSCVLAYIRPISAASINEAVTIITRVFETITRERSYRITGNERATGNYLVQSVGRKLFSLVVDVFQRFVFFVLFPSSRLWAKLKMHTGRSASAIEPPPIRLISEHAFYKPPFCFYSRDPLLFFFQPSFRGL